jgi:hypothetical protein
MDWIDLTHGTDRWRAVVKEAMNSRVTQIAENFLPSAIS